MVSPSNIKKLTDSVWVTFSSRLAMIVTLPLGWMYFQSAIEEPLLKLATRVEYTEAAIRTVQDRVLTIETNYARIRPQRDAFQDATTQKLSEIDRILTQLSTQLASLAATLQAMRDRSDASQLKRAG